MSDTQYSPSSSESSSSGVSSELLNSSPDLPSASEKYIHIPLTIIPIDSGGFAIYEGARRDYLGKVLLSSDLEQFLRLRASEQRAEHKKFLESQAERARAATGLDELDIDFDLGL